MPLHATTLIAPHSCATLCTTEFCAQTFGHISAYTTGIIGYDRYLRMRYLTDYSRLVRPWMICTAVFTAVLLSLSHGAAYALGVFYDWFDTAGTVGSVVDGAVFIFMIVPYVLLVRAIARHRRESTHKCILEQADDTVNKIAFRIVIAVILLYTPHVLMTTVRQCLPRGSGLRNNRIFVVALLLGYQLIYVNSSVNSLIFISYNSACRKKLISMLRCSTSSTTSSVDVKKELVKKRCQTV